LQEVLLRADDSAVATLFFHIDSRQSGFVIRLRLHDLTSI
jgi:hypothetical protein